MIERSYGREYSSDYADCLCCLHFLHVRRWTQGRCVDGCGAAGIDVRRCGSGYNQGNYWRWWLWIRLGKCYKKRSYRKTRVCCLIVSEAEHLVETFCIVLFVPFTVLRSIQEHGWHCTHCPLAVSSIRSRIVRSARIWYNAIWHCPHWEMRASNHMRFWTRVRLI